MKPQKLLAPAWAAALVACGATPSPDPIPEVPVATFPDRPTPGPPASFSPAMPVATTLSNGIPVYVIHDPGLPLVSVRLMVPTGSANDPKGQYGLASLGTSMLSEGAGPRSSLEQSAALSEIATKLWFQAGREHTVMGLDTHVDQLGAALPLAADALLRPRFDAADWARVQDQHVNGLLASYDDNAAVARVVAPRRWWGADHPYGKPAAGTPESAKALTLAQVKAWHTAEIHAEGAAILVVGAATVESATALLEAGFGSWPTRPRPALEVPPPAAPSGLVVVDSPGSTQTVISAVTAGQSEQATERAPLDIAQVVMGGSFTSRLNRRLREELGLTYGARMSVSRLRAGGVITSGGAFRGDATAQALTELRAVLTKATTEGFSSDEVARGRAQVLTDLVDGAETRAGLADLYMGEISAGRRPADLATWLSALDATGPEAAKSVAKFDAETSLFVLVGDVASMTEPLRAAGFPTWTVANKEGLSSSP